MQLKLHKPTMTIGHSLRMCARLADKPFHSSSFRYRLTYIDRYVINPDASCARAILSQPITTLENVSYISLAQPELKKLWIISQTSYLTVASISGQCQYITVHVNAEYAHEMPARERLRSILVTSSVTRLL